MNPDAAHAIWQDPSTYDADLHGPPYLRGKEASARREVVQRALVSSARGRAEVIHRLASVEPGHELPTLLAHMRGLAQIHQSAHWKTAGETFYGDHLLFERLYNQTFEGVDGLAERVVGLLGPEKVDAWSQAEGMLRFIQSVFEPASDGTVMLESLVASALRAETTFRLTLQVTVKALKARDELSRGTDNLIADVEDRHEGHIYLLQQRADILPTTKQETP
jgi:DNA-binding ferritin-like protein